MLNSKIIYKYYKGWCSYDKEGYDEYSYKETSKKYANGETFFVVAQRENEDKPFATIMISDRNSFYVLHLNENQDIDVEYRYVILYNLNKNKIFLYESMIREYDYENNNLRKNINKVNSYYFATTHFNDKKDCFEWYILDKVNCEEIDYVTEEIITYKSKNIVNQDSLWEDIPVFGDWDSLLKDKYNRIKFDEIKD